MPKIKPPIIPDDKASLVANIMYYFGYNAVSDGSREGDYYAEKIAAIPLVELTEIALEYAESYDDEAIRSRVGLGEFIDDRVTHDKRFDPIHGAVNVCDACGEEFLVYYHANGDYEYVTDPCECEAEFHPADGGLSISEWLETLI